MKDGDKPKPALTIFWNNDNQTFHFETDETQIFNLEMASAVLGLVQEAVKFNINLVRAQMMQQRQVQAMQEAAIRSKILTPH